jgi:hypothetical protein
MIKGSEILEHLKDKDRRVRNDWIGFTYNLDVRILLWFRDSEYAL